MIANRVFWLCGLMACACAVRAQDEAADVLRQVASCQQRHKALWKKIGEARRDADFAEARARQAARVFALPYAPERVASAERGVEEAEARAQRVLDQIEAAKVVSAEDRLARKNQAEARIKELDEAIKGVEHGFDAEWEELRADSQEIAAALQSHLRRAMRAPLQYSIGETRVTVEMERGLARLVWLDGLGVPFASAECQLPRPMPMDLRECGRVADSYPVTQIANNYLRFWVNDVDVTFRACKTEWMERKKVRELLAQLLDLEVIAWLPAAKAAVEGPDVPEQARTGDDLLQQLPAYVSRLDALNAKVEAATMELRGQRHAAYAIAHELGKPYEAARIPELEAGIKATERSVTMCLDRLAAEQVEVPHERQTYRARSEVQAVHARLACEAVQKQFDAEAAKLKAEAAQLNLALERLVEDIVKLPEGVGAATVKVMPDALNAQILFRWYRPDGRSLGRVYLDLLQAQEPKRHRDRGLVSGTYRIHSLTAARMTVWVDGIWVRVGPDLPEWQDEGKLPKLLERLVDLDGIAALPNVAAAAE